MKKSRILCFGEIMLRLSPAGHERLVQAHSLELRFGGAEANVAVALAGLDHHAVFISSLPRNPLGDAALQVLRGCGVDTSAVARGGSRIGVYYLEHGASMRPSRVVYDRAGSSFAASDAAAYDWPALLDGAAHVHVTGITPALSSACAEATRAAMTEARSRGVRVSFDLNYRKNLWTREEAGALLTDLVRSTDLLIANETDPADVLGMPPARGDAESGVIDAQAYADLAQGIAERFGIPSVAITLRQSRSASSNGWSALLYTDGRLFTTRTYDIEVVDRVGAGDAFAAGLIHGSVSAWDPQHTLDFAVAASALKHSIPGDFLVASAAEIDAVASGDLSGRVRR